MFMVAVATFAHSPHYDIALQLDPAASRWSAQVDATAIRYRGDVARLYFHRGIVIRTAEVDGKIVQPLIDPPDATPFWISADHAIDVPCPKRTLRLRYDGPGKLHPDGRNQVSPELVELSLYGGWYPLTSLDDRFTWTLRTALPKAWHYATPTYARETVAAGKRQLRMRSTTPADVVFVASPRFTVLPIVEGGVAARVFYRDTINPAEQARAVELGKDGAGMAAWLQGLIGPASKDAALRPDVVFTLRGGSLSYSRLPLIILREQTLSEAGDRDARLNIRHEIAHFWSRAKGAPNDWINEGVAEYLAIVRTGDVEGPASRAAIIAKYRAAAAAAGPGEPIATAGDDDRGYINRYVRPALMLDASEHAAGRVRMEDFLRRFAALGEGQDTAAFRRLAIDALGPEAGGTLSRCLDARDWPAACGGSTRQSNA